MNARTIAGVQAQITAPTDVIEFIHAARADHSGTDYPGALQLSTTIAKQFSYAREARQVAAWFIIALEGDSHTSSIAQQELIGYLEALND